MKVHGHSLTSVINREALELPTKRNLKLQLVNSTSSEPRPPPLWIRVITPCCVQCYWVANELSGSTELGADCHPIESHGRCQGLGRMMAIFKNLPTWDHWEKKKGRHPVLEVYYFSYKLICMWAFRAPLTTFSAVADGKVIGTGGNGWRAKIMQEVNSSYGFLTVYVEQSGVQGLRLLSMVWEIFHRYSCCFDGRIRRKEDYT